MQNINSRMMRPKRIRRPHLKGKTFWFLFGTWLKHINIV